MNNLNHLPSEKLSCIEPLRLNDRASNLFIKRDDFIHPIISGNKWRKLTYNILHAKSNRMGGILTFGGAYSNHLIATALASKLNGLDCIGVVRGDELNSSSNLILSFCEGLGMSLKFISRLDYALKEEPVFKQELLSEYPNYWIIPEGGANYQGVIGCMNIMKETDNDYDIVCVSQGTTTTSIGILLSIPTYTKLLVCPALKGFDAHLEMKQRMLKMGFETDFVLEKLSQVIVLPTDKLGKYGKASAELKSFNHDLVQRTKISFDWTYNAKSLYNLNEYIESNSIFQQKMLYIHTGGFS
jgi:1-aminocyclopropane-1-carboxylate deaminase